MNLINLPPCPPSSLKSECSLVRELGLFNEHLKNEKLVLEPKSQFESESGEQGDRPAWVDAGYQPEAVELSKFEAEKSYVIRYLPPRVAAPLPPVAAPPSVSASESTLLDESRQHAESRQKSRHGGAIRRSRAPRNPWVKLLNNKRNSAQVFQLYKHGAAGKKQVLMTWEEIRDQFERQKGRCFWLGVKIDPMHIFVSWHPLAPSLDRLDNAKCYEVGNVVITTRFANLGRGRLTVEQFIPHIRKLRKLLDGEMWPKFLFDELPPIVGE